MRQKCVCSKLQILRADLLKPIQDIEIHNKINLVANLVKFYFVYSGYVVKTYSCLYIKAKTRKI